MMGKTKQCDSTPTPQLQTRDTRTIGAIIRLNGIIIKSGQYTRYRPSAREATYSSY